MGMLRVPDQDELLDQLNAIGITFTNAASEIIKIKGEASTPTVGGPQPFAFCAAKPSANLEITLLAEVHRIVM